MEEEDFGYFAAKCDDPAHALKYLMGKDSSMPVRVPTQDGKWAVVVRTPRKFTEFNAHRMGRRGPLNEIIRPSSDHATQDLVDLYKIQPQ